MKRLNVNKPLRVKAIHIKGSSKPLHDRVVYIADNFLIVGQDEGDTAPTWYNIDKIDKLEGVKELEEKKIIPTPSYYF